MRPDRQIYRVLIASYLEPEQVERIANVDGRLQIVYEPDLLRRPRYRSDHTGQPSERSQAQEDRWRQLLGEADVLFDFDQTHREDLPELAPNVRWIQATSAGIGQFVKQMGYAARMPGTVFTTASGVHIQPLAEFCLMSMAMFSRGLLKMVRDQAQKEWNRYAGTDLAGRTVVIVGVGAIGAEVARMCKAMEMRVLGIKSRVEGVLPEELNLDELFGSDRLDDALGQAEYLILTAPHTPKTEGMIGSAELSLLPRGAFFINIGRGALVDEAALVEALRSDHLGGASLDVFAQEPPDRTLPVYQLPNVVVTPHTAGVSDGTSRKRAACAAENVERIAQGLEPLYRIDQ